MATFEEQRATLSEKHAREVAELEAKHAVLSAFPADVAAYDAHVHMHRLYDRDGSIKFETSRYSSIAKGPAVTLDTVAQVAAAFPTAVQLSLYREGSIVGIRTAADAEAHAEKSPNGADVTPIAPFWLEVDPGISADLSIHWIAFVGARVMEIEITFPLHSEVSRAIGALRVEYERAGRHQDRIVGVRTNRFEVSQPLRVLQATGRDRWARADYIRYGSGAMETPGRHLIYFDSCDGEHADLTIADLVAGIKRSKGE